MNLRQFLDETGMPITELARRSNVSPATIHNVLAGKKDLYLSVAIMIEEATKGRVTHRELLPEHLLEDHKGRYSQKKPNKKKDSQ